MRLITFIRRFWRITNRQRIPKLPRGMLATHYDVIDENAARVMARLGIRDPLGLRVAMRRHKVHDVDQLVAKLDHYQARRNLRERAMRVLGRAAGGQTTPPHRAEILRYTRPPAEDERAIAARLKTLKRKMRQ